jgi:hypothetical protein
MIPKKLAPAKAGVADFSAKIMRKKRSRIMLRRNSPAAAARSFWLVCRHWYHAPALGTGVLRCVRNGDRRFH